MRQRILDSEGVSIAYFVDGGSLEMNGSRDQLRAIVLNDFYRPAVYNALAVSVEERSRVQ